MYGRWYIIHAANQGLGLLLAIAAAIISLTTAQPIPRRRAPLQSGPFAHMGYADLGDSQVQGEGATQGRLPPPFCPPLERSYLSP